MAFSKPLLAVFAVTNLDLN